MSVVDEDAKPEYPELVVPHWIKVASNEACKLFGVEHYAVYVRIATDQELLDDAIDPVPSNNDIGGNCDTTPRYLFAEIKLNSDIKRDADGYDTIAHEFYHVVQADLLQANERIIELVDPSLQPHARALFEDGNERAATLIGRMVGPIIRKRTERKLQKAAEAEQARDEAEQAAPQIDEEAFMRP